MGTFRPVRRPLLHATRPLRTTARRRRLSHELCPDRVAVRRGLVRRRVGRVPEPGAGRAEGWPGRLLDGDWDVDAVGIPAAGEVAAGPGSPTVAFDRHGRPLLVSGRLPADPDAEVCAEVAARHETWGTFCRAVRDHLASSTRDGRSYQPLRHPDLAGAAHAHDEGPVAMIRPVLPDPPARVLDVGCNWGHFVAELAADGHRCTGIDRSPAACRFARGLTRAEELDVEIVEGSVFDHDVSGYDVVLALNVFHHFLKRPTTLRGLEVLLGRITADTIVFQPHWPDYFDGVPAAWDPTPEEFAEWVADRSGTAVDARLGVDDDRRPLYLLRR